MRSSATLPPLQALRAFEAVARLMSFRAAGEELLITQSAVSHHIRALEEHLGARLFIRKARGIEMTPAGEQYFETVRRAFALIATGTGELKGRAGKTRVRVSVLPSFAANWLVPRLDRFAAAHPEIDLALDPTLKLANLNADEADFAIRFGDGNWPGVDCQVLMTERLTPVASPALLRGAAADMEPRDLLNYPLLFALHPYEWEVWAEAVGLDLAAARIIKLTDYNVVVQAALEGKGIAIGRLLLVADRLRSGALVQPCKKTVTSPRVAHWLVTAQRAGPSDAARAVMDWLRAEAAAAVQAEAPYGEVLKLAR